MFWHVTVLQVLFGLKETCHYERKQEILPPKIFFPSKCLKTNLNMTLCIPQPLTASTDHIWPCSASKLCLKGFWAKQGLNFGGFHPFTMSNTPWYSWDPRFIWSNTLPDLQQPPGTKTGHVRPPICLWSAFEGTRAALTLVWTLLSGLTPLGIAGLQNLYNKPPCLTFGSLLGPKLAMCDLQSVSDQLLKAVELPWRWFGPF